MTYRLVAYFVLVGLVSLAMVWKDVTWLYQLGTWRVPDTELHWIVYSVVCAVAALVASYEPRFRVLSFLVLAPAITALTVRAMMIGSWAIGVGFGSDITVNLLLLIATLCSILVLLHSWGFGLRDLGRGALLFTVSSAYLGYQFARDGLGNA